MNRLSVTSPLNLQLCRRTWTSSNCSQSPPHSNHPVQLLLKMKAKKEMMKALVEKTTSEDYHLFKVKTEKNFHEGEKSIEKTKFELQRKKKGG